MADQSSLDAAQSATSMNVAILFGGGDAPGMNPLLRAFVRLGINRFGASVLGIKDGFAGLVWTCHQLASAELYEDLLRKQIAQYVGRRGLERSDQYTVRMDHDSVSHIHMEGGIVLGTSRCSEFLKEDVRRDVTQLLNMLEVDAVVVVGDDGSMQGAAALALDSGLPIIGIPATIDNDYPLTELSLGADTAVSKVVQMARNVNVVASATRRIMVLETMGRDSGELAIRAAIAAGAEIVVTPELGLLNKAKMTDIARRITASMERGRKHAVVIIAEGVKTQGNDNGRVSEKVSEKLVRFLTNHFGDISIDGARQHVDIRNIVPGYLQRGEAPTSHDIRLAIDYVEAAWDALACSRPKTGVLGLVDGRIKLQAFDAKPSFDRQGRFDRNYALFKDMSNRASADKPAASTTKPKRKATSAPKK